MDFSATPERLLLVVLLSLSTGWALGQYWRAREVRRNKHRVRREAKIIIQDAKRERTTLLLDAELQKKQRFVDEMARIDTLVKQREEELQLREQSVEKEQEEARQLLTRLASANASLADRQREIAHREHEIDEKEEEVSNKLELLAGISLEEAKSQLIGEARRLGEADASREFQFGFNSKSEELTKKLYRVVAESAERVARAVASECSTVVVTAPSEEMKGRIVGRDGRNIRAFEALSGVDVLVDEIDGAILLSSFDAKRRRVAKLALERLILDGRIQPTRIRDFLRAAEVDICAEVRDLLEKRLYSLKISNLPAELINFLVELQFRARDGQNTLEHLIECAEIAAGVAAELKLPQNMAEAVVRASLLHDIGKALPAEVGRAHAISGAELLQRHGEEPLVVNAVAAHHREVPDESLVAPIVRAVDAMSGGRVGARREVVSNVISRVEEMERIAKQHKGVTSAYAFQGGRELQVIVLSDVVSEYELSSLAQQIFEETGGNAKVSVVRETVKTVGP